MTNSMEQSVIKNPTWLILLMYFIITFAFSNVSASPFICSNIRNCKQSELPKVVTVPENICNTPACNHAASRIRNNMDSTIEPCDDFYKFACGKYMQNTTIPDDETYVDKFTLIEDKVQEQLRKIIEDPIMPDERKPAKLVKNFYKSCMNKKAIEEQGLEPLLKILQKLGGWPVLEGDNWNENDFDWIQSVYKLYEIGYSMDCFIDLSIELDSKNSTRNVLTLDQPKLQLSRKYLIERKNDTILKAYANYMIDVAVILGASRENAIRELSESLAFEQALANISLPEEKLRNATSLYNIRSIQQLSTDYRSVPWKEYFNKYLAPKTKIYDNDTIIVHVPSYISNFEKLVNKTPKRIQANYAMWRVVSKTIRYLNENIRKRQLEYDTVLSGKTERRARWKECVDIVARRLSLSVDSLYVKKYFNEDSKKVAIDMVNDIKNQFHEILKQVDWMDENTRKIALDKVASMTAHIAYPDEILDDNKLEEYYSDLELSGNNYLQTILNLTLFDMEFVRSEFRKPVNKSDWKSHEFSTVVNAFYSATENSIIFPAAILQGGFFNSKQPKYMNYGAIGFIIGHEITHGFDDQGRQYNKDGNLVNWWASKTEKKYLDKAQCIIDQYSNYTDAKAGLNLNGINTQGENIADNGGIKVSYLAYKKWASKNEEEQTLPGLHYNPKQLFWISAANTWCVKYRPEELKHRITTNNHSPGEFRTLGPFSNMIDFAKDFNCPVGSKMNPNSNCAVW